MTISINSADRPQITGFILLVAQLGLVLLVADQFLIEQTYGFGKLIPIIFVGFIIHTLLPLRWRALFFLLLFPVSAIALLGILSGAALIGLGIVLFLICHIPVSITARAAILIVVAIFLAAIRGGAIELPVPQAYWAFSRIIQTQTLPILSAMFMFRAVVYLYDLRNEKGPVSYWQRLGYFFMFPNVCFPLFPVIDYQTYKRTYFNRAPYEIYQQGINWILRGITHLLLYRIVYHYFVPDPLLVDSFAEVGQYALSSFLLYLRVSGLFHLIIGILSLFGYNLPETHHRYYLAASFTDFWRRINIYWKDFMMKLFYYPIFLRLRGWGMTRAMIAATLITFVITWALHSYQWFWLRGTFPVHPQDVLFWSILAVLVTANSLYEEKYGRKRKKLTKNFVLSPREALVYSVKVVTVFVVICVLWSFWTSSSIEQWLAVMSVAVNASALEWLSFVALWALAVVIGVAIQLYGDRRSQATVDRSFSLPHRAAWVGGTAILMLAIANPGVSDRLDPRAVNLVATITGDQMNTRDQQHLVKGYYEEMLGGETSGAMAWSVLPDKPDNWQWNGEPESEHIIATDDIRSNVFRPTMTATHKGRDFITNQWGLRGPEIEKAKPPGTHRIAMLGSSYTVGAGVDVELTFPSLLQDHLNDGNTGVGAEKFEVLNLAYPGESILRGSTRLEKQALDFGVDIVIYMSVTDEIQFALRNLRDVVKHSTKDVDPALLDIAERAEVTADMTADEIERRLRPFGEELIVWGYQELARFSRQHNVPAIVFVLPRTGDTDSHYDKEWEFLSRIVEDAGLVVVDLWGVYGPVRDRGNLKLAPWDWHPNAKGHELLGLRIYQDLMELEVVRFADASEKKNANLIK
jgi:D-alanyl-lipoteichoic acid acyltransferase DltB (MBOAT superfamily)